MHVHAPAPIEQERPLDNDVRELLGVERLLLVFRLAGVALMGLAIVLYRTITPAIVAAGMAGMLLAALLQRRSLREGLPLQALRRRAFRILVVDLAAVLAVGTATAADPAWVGFYFYPILALEAVLVAGPRPALVVTGATIAAYWVQAYLHLALGNDHGLREIVLDTALVGLTGGAMVVFGWLSIRERRNLRVLLDLTRALAFQRSETELLELLDAELRATVSARVRSIALRNGDGSFQIVRWHSTEQRTLSREALDRAFGDTDAVTRALARGSALTWQVEPGSSLGPALGLPDWTRGVTLVPIVAESRWVGVLPVLWSAPTVPSATQLRLLHGLAGQMGLALAQGELVRVRAQAVADPLTGLLNRRAIDAELEEYLARAARTDGRLAVLFCDLDGFKRLNDASGHDAGDAGLRAVAEALRHAVRMGDEVGRYGGDEFVVVAADAGREESTALAGRIGAAVRAAVGHLGIDVTIGIAIRPDDGTGAEALVAAADRAMYRGKAAGRGSVVHAGGDGPPGAA